ncbi:MAG: hypothetical protein QOD71_366 [Thermoleophilaceae bacterium]|nr:hypothetical protein [Thermoleophilaceae bacterium]
MGPQHELIPLAERGRWADALSEVPHGHAHTWDLCRAIQLTSGLPTYLYRYERGTARVVCPIAERDFDGAIDVTTPYGFGGFAMSGDCERFPEDWMDFARSRGWVCGYIALNPLFCDGHGFASDEVHVHNRLYVMDLGGSDRELHERLSRNRRRQLRNWSAVAAGLEHDRERLTDHLLGTYEDFFARKGAGSATDFTAETMAAIASLDDVFLVGAGEGGQVESVAVFAYTPYSGDALFSVSAPGGERHAAHLVWAAVQRLRAEGVERLNLGGGVREGDDVAEFKRRFGASELPLVSLRQVYQPSVYEQLCRQAAVTSDRAGWFPPYRAAGSSARRER